MNMPSLLSRGLHTVNHVLPAGARVFSATRVPTGCALLAATVAAIWHGMYAYQAFLVLHPSLAILSVGLWLFKPLSCVLMNMLPAATFGLN